MFLSGKETVKIIRSRDLATRIFLQAAFITACALISGLLVNQIRSDHLPIIGGEYQGSGAVSESEKIETVSPDEAARLYLSGGVLFVDARSSDDYRSGHIRGALSLPLETSESRFDVVLADVSRDTAIITYCDGEECSLGRDLARELYYRGYGNVRVLSNGWSVWKKLELPTEKDA